MAVRPRLPVRLRLPASLLLLTTLTTFAGAGALTACGAAISADAGEPGRDPAPSTLAAADGTAPSPPLDVPPASPSITDPLARLVPLPVVAPPQPASPGPPAGNGELSAAGSPTTP